MKHLQFKFYTLFVHRGKQVERSVCNILDEHFTVRKVIIENECRQKLI
jgi:hypothetical protein